MASPEFKKLTEEEKKDIEAKTEDEKDFMAEHDFYSDPANRQFRKLAVSAIATHCQGNDFDAFVPYLAMNHFDRFISKSAKPYSDIEEVRKVAMTCLLMAATDRAYPECFFSESEPLDFDTAEIEDQIYDALQVELAVTPFYFLDYFYPPFEEIGGLSRRCINEIIVQAQGVDDFNTHNFSPSEIAYSSLLAAAHIAYPSVQIQHERVPVEMRPTFCVKLLVDICTEQNIMIEKASSSSANVVEEIYDIDHDVDDDDDLAELYPAEAPRRLMHFYLQWPTNVAD